MMKDYVDVQTADTRMEDVREALVVAAEIDNPAKVNSKFFKSYLDQARAAKPGRATD